MQGDPITYCQPDTHCNRNCNPESHCNPDSYAEPYQYAQPIPDRNLHGLADQYRNPNPEPIPDY